MEIMLSCHLYKESASGKEFWVVSAGTERKSAIKTKLMVLVVLVLSLSLSSGALGAGPGGEPGRDGIQGDSHETIKPKEAVFRT